MLSSDAAGDAAVGSVDPHQFTLDKLRSRTDSIMDSDDEVYIDRMTKF